MPDRMVCVEQESVAGTVRTWHLGAVPGETLCGQTALSMKALPKAAWDQVLNPCTYCQLKADLPVAFDESGGGLVEAPEVVDAPEVIDAHHDTERHARRE